MEFAVLVSIGNLWLTVFHLKRFCVFFCVEEIQPFVLSFSTGSSKMLATCPWNLFEAKLFYIKYLFRSVRTLSEKKSASRWKFPGEVVKTAIPVSVKIFLGEPLFWDEILFFQSFFDIEQKKCYLLAYVFRLSWKNCFFECLLNFLGKFLKLKFSFSNQFCTWARIFRIFDKNVFAGWSKLQFTRPQAHNDETKCLETFYFSIFFGHRSKVLAFW